MGFSLAAVGLVVVTPMMVSASTEIAEITGLGTTFIGTTLVAIVTSLPELVTTIAAVRIGADDMAIGNLFGSNLFNMFALGLTDVFYLPGRFLGVIDPGLPAGGNAGPADDRHGVDRQPGAPGKARAVHRGGCAGD